jgi:uncharacterized membrane protein
MEGFLMAKSVPGMMVSLDLSLFLINMVVVVIAQTTNYKHANKQEVRDTLETTSKIFVEPYYSFKGPYHE